MYLHELKSLLRTHPACPFRLQLPNSSSIPVCFHVTEVARVQKSFIDCGGTRRDLVTCQLQIWVGPDLDHRLEAGKTAAILEQARDYFPDEGIPVEIEYEDRVISQYTIEGHEIDGGQVVLNLAHKHTTCLAPEKCGTPPVGLKLNSNARVCLGPDCC